MALVCVCLGARTGSVAAMLVLIQLMKLFLRTGQGELTDFMGGDSVHNLHSMCQGNGAALASWMALSLVIVRVYNRLGSGKKCAPQ